MSARPATAARKKPSQRPGLRVVRRRTAGLIKRVGGRRMAPLAIVSAIVAGAIVFGVLLEQVVLAQSAFRLTKIRAEVAQAEALHQELLLEAARLESPGRIERVAKTKLAMVPAAGIEYIVADVGVYHERLDRGGASVAQGAAGASNAAAIGSVDQDGSP